MMDELESVARMLDVVYDRAASVDEQLDELEAAWRWTKHALADVEGALHALHWQGMTERLEERRASLLAELGRMERTLRMYERTPVLHADDEDDDE